MVLLLSSYTNIGYGISELHAEDAILWIERSSLFLPAAKERTSVPVPMARRSDTGSVYLLLPYLIPSSLRLLPFLQHGS